MIRDHARLHLALTRERVPPPTAAKASATVVNAELADAMPVNRCRRPLRKEATPATNDRNPNRSRNP